MKHQRDHDTNLAVLAGIVILTYGITFLGSCSPVYCKLIVSLAGFICILLSVGTGNYIGNLIGLEPSDASLVIPILMLGIGLDDMFVICNALDQVSLNLPPADRMKQAFRHSGPSITITSVTNALAFLSGAYTDIEAI